jgi:hypothetical protein
MHAAGTQTSHNTAQTQLIEAAGVGFLLPAIRDPGGTVAGDVPALLGPADVAALAVHLMINTAVTGATYDIDGGQQFVE